MSEPLVCTFRWTSEELLTATRYHRRHQVRRPIRFAAHAVAFLILTVSAASLVTSGFSSAPAGFLFGGVYWYLLRPLELRWWTRRRFTKRPDANTLVTWSLAERGVTTAAEGLGTSEFAWNAVHKCVHTPNGLLLYSLDNLFHWIPNSGFASLEAAQRASELVRRNVAQYSALA